MEASARSPDDMVEFYDPTDLFGDLAESLAEAYPGAIARDEDDDDEDDEDADAEPTSRRRDRAGTPRD